MECKIKKINRHKREALVELEMMGATREVKLMLEVVEKR
jgi:transcriptional antiterminator NusG